MYERENKKERWVVVREEGTKSHFCFVLVFLFCWLFLFFVRVAC